MKETNEDKMHAYGDPESPWYNKHIARDAKGAARREGESVIAEPAPQPEIKEKDTGADAGTESGKKPEKSPAEPPKEKEERKEERKEYTAKELWDMNKDEQARLIKQYGAEVPAYEKDRVALLLELQKA